MKKTTDLTNQRFGRLTVHGRQWCNEKNRNLWFCQCDCGNFTHVPTSDLLKGKTKSCGCIRKETTSTTRKTHGKSNSRIYGIWYAIKKRCQHETDKQYKDYGGRGITICDEWKNDFQAFYDWAMANGYEEHLTIDRIDVNGNYEPSNCKWSTEKEQSNNRRNNRTLTYNGKTQTLQQWSDETGISAETIFYRIKRKWDVERALTTPPRSYKHKRQVYS